MKRTFTAVAKNQGRKVTIKATYEIDLIYTGMDREQMDYRFNLLRDEMYKLINEKLPFHNCDIQIK